MYVRLHNEPVKPSQALYAPLIVSEYVCIDWRVLLLDRHLRPIDWLLHYSTYNINQTSSSLMDTVSNVWLLYQALLSPITVDIAIRIASKLRSRLATRLCSWASVKR